MNITTSLLFAAFASWSPSWVQPPAQPELPIQVLPTGHWIEIATMLDGTTVAVDTLGLRRTGYRVVFLERTLQAEPSADGAQIRMAQVEINCDARTSSMIAHSSFTLDGHLTASYLVPPAEREVREIQKDSPVETMMRIVCGFG